ALALAAGLTGAGLGIAAAVGGRTAVRIAVPVAAAAWTYDLVAKDTPAGPAVMAAARGVGRAARSRGATAEGGAAGLRGRRAHAAGGAGGWWAAGGGAGRRPGGGAARGPRAGWAAAGPRGAAPRVA